MLCYLRSLLTSICDVGAIMFGDKVPEAEVGQFLTAGQRTSLPFQCAHGRPSMLPVAVLLPPSERYQVRYASICMSSCLTTLHDPSVFCRKSLGANSGRPERLDRLVLFYLLIE